VGEIRESVGCRRDSRVKGICKLRAELRSSSFYVLMRRALEIIMVLMNLKIALKP
jgi:hypothetical protein